jgi:hypothetical protein
MDCVVKIFGHLICTLAHVKSDEISKLRYCLLLSG